MKTPDTWNRTIRNWNSKFDTDGNYFVLYAILGINTAVFSAWWYANGVYKTYGDTSVMQFMTRNFLCGWKNIDDGRIWTMLTCNFSHNEPWHFILNSFVLYSFGQAVIDIVGGRAFALIYLGAGLTSSLFTMGLRNRNEQFVSHGASGSVTACTLVYALTYPWSTVYLLFVPVPAIIAIGGFVLYDLYRTSTKTGGRVDTAAHLGGAAFGLGYYWMRVRPALRRFR
ncbi:hypothetical protein SmJEL517_g04236 [Synchytrium microbalum]|uniref:Peptidase S54 rhomboid domain-containing protein n=1 Tax=Synchytrium microbalum TaxID=1806994 RepID=A0A507BT25_9FUNG|nr:uncharacterized protein SmJEL517_g04236 [Synchytrium microbalum]TPX32730.1 hypothetical protein SmJEL517_g04236 [Synchytrium microbalum]